MSTAIRSAAKKLANLVAVVVVSPGAATCWLEKRLAPDSETAFGFWSQMAAMMPGLPGLYLRRAFYHLTLESCSLDCYIGFGALFTHRRVVVEDQAYVGPYSLIGCSTLRTGCLIGSRASVLSGPALHSLDEKGRWLPTDMSKLRQVEIGEHAWLGEGAIVMVDVGRGSFVGAGAVVSSRVGPGVTVAGNPARFVRRLGPEPETPTVTAGREE